MAIYPSNGSRLFIGSSVTDRDTDWVSSDFNTQSWTEISGLTNLGELGDQSELISANIINLNRTKKAKGTRNAGSMAIVCAFNYADEGQLAFRAAEATVFNYAFKLVFPDAPSVSGDNSTRTFVGLVMGARTQFNEANNVIQLMGAIEINSNIVEDDANA